MLTAHKFPEHDFHRRRDFLRCNSTGFLPTIGVTEFAYRAVYGGYDVDVIGDFQPTANKIYRRYFFGREIGH